MSSDLSAAISGVPKISIEDLEASLRATLKLWCPLKTWAPSISSPTSEKSIQDSDRFYTWFPSLGFETPVEAIIWEHEESDAQEVYMGRIPVDQGSFDVMSGTGYVRGKKGLGNFAVLAIIASVARCGYGLIIDSSQAWMPEYFEDELYDLEYVDNWVKALVKEVGFEGMIQRFDSYWE